MISLELAEHGSSVSVRLDQALGRALADSRLVEAKQDPAVAGQWLVRARGTVGAATMRAPGSAGLTLRISPKVPVKRLLFLLNYSRNPKNPRGWQTEDVQVDEDRDLLPVLARFFAFQADKALSQGLLKGYGSVEETALVIRGRIRTSEQAHSHHGRLVPLETARDEYTSDIAENRLVRAACEVLISLPGWIPGEVRERLLRLRIRLADITPVGRGHELPKWQPNRLNVRYHKVLRLADLVLRGDSVESRPGDVTVNGFLFDMPTVFEDFVTIALREVLAEHIGYCVLQATHHLDEHNAIRMIPDFVRYADDGTPLAVVDAKYKVEKPRGFPDADLYQMLAYCTALNLPAGHLVYAKGNAPYGSHRVKHAGITIHQHALELDQSPDGLLKDIRTLAERLTRAL